jgi:hypothetical protein
VSGMGFVVGMQRRSATAACPHTNPLAPLRERRIWRAAPPAGAPEPAAFRRLVMPCGNDDLTSLVRFLGRVGVWVGGGQAPGAAARSSLLGGFSLRSWFSLRGAGSLRESPPGIRPGRRPTFFAGAKKVGKESTSKPTWLSVRPVCCLLHNRAPSRTRRPAAQTSAVVVLSFSTFHDREVLTAPPVKSAVLQRFVEGAVLQRFVKSAVLHWLKGSGVFRRGPVITEPVWRALRGSTQRTRLFEPPCGEFGPGQSHGTGSSRGDLTPKWVSRCFLCPLSLHQQRKGVGCQAEFPAGSHAVSQHHAVRTTPRRQATHTPRPSPLPPLMRERACATDRPTVVVYG